MNRILCLFFLFIPFFSISAIYAQGKSTTSISQYDKQSIENLAILAKTWGFLKYYHPAVASGKYDWDTELFKIMPDILNAKSVPERNSILYKWIQNLGEFEISEITYPDKEKVKIYPDISWVEDKSILGDVSELLVKIKTAKRDGKNVYVNMNQAMIGQVFEKENPYADMSYPDTGYRLLALFRYWNAIEYYFPYKYLIKENWSDILSEFIPQFIDTKDEISYGFLISKLITRIKDSHAVLFGSQNFESYKGMNVSPLKISIVESKAVITGYYNTELKASESLKTGDIILSIDNEPIDSIIHRKLIYTPASNLRSKLRDIAYQIFRTTKEKIPVEYLRDGIIKSDTVLCYPKQQVRPMPFETNKSPYQFLTEEKNIGYIYPGGMEPMDMPDMSKTKGIIIDFRSYPMPSLKTPGEGYDMFNLMEKPYGFAKLTEGNAMHPGLFTFLDVIEGGNHNQNPYKGKIIILVNEVTQSQPEFLTMFYRMSPNAIVVGSETAGADGNMFFLPLPGGMTTAFSGMGVYYPDGTETQQVGIKPDIEVRPTIKGIKEGKDELLEKAISLIKD